MSDKRAVIDVQPFQVRIRGILAGFSRSVGFPGFVVNGTKKKAFVLSFRSKEFCRSDRQYFNMCLVKIHIVIVFFEDFILSTTTKVILYIMDN